MTPVSHIVSPLLKQADVFFFGNREIRDTYVNAGTKFPIHKVWWLREASEIGQTFIHLCEKVV